MTVLGRRTALEAREDERAIRRIRRLTSLEERTVAARLARANGRMLVRNVFADEWPTDAPALGRVTVGLARRIGLHDELLAITGATRTLVSRRLNSSHGKQLLRNAFWDCWPEIPEASDAEPPPIVADEEDGDDVVAEEPLANETPPEAPPSASPTEIGVGRMLSGRYELKRELGRGGFGTTYEAHDRLSGMDLVVKIPHDHDGESVKRELRQAFRLLHPNICQAFPERDDEAGRPFLVLQHGGEDLTHRIERTGEPLPLQLAVHVLVSLADALDYLHDRLVVHLDVSPDNTLIDQDDGVRLTDFGASSNAREQVAPDGARTIVATSVSALNRMYAAPEMLYGQGRSRSDQFSLALVFCSLLEGRVFRDRYRLRRLETLTDAQQAAVAKALSQYPDDRFESCGEFARAVADEMGRVPKEVLKSDLERLSFDLLQRFQRETERSERGTARLGGVVLLGRSLERFLHAMLLWIASTEGFDAEEALRAIDPRSSGLARATAGRIVKTIVSREDMSEASLRVVGPILDDLRRDASHVWKLINVRNEIVHGQREPTAILEAGRHVAGLLETQRRHAGWT